MTVKELKKILANVDETLEVHWYNEYEGESIPVDFADVDDLIRMENGERVYNEETDEYETFKAFILG